MEKNLKIYMNTYTHTHTHTHIYIDIYIHKENHFAIHQELTHHFK